MGFAERQEVDSIWVGMVYCEQWKGGKDLDGSGGFPEWKGRRLDAGIEGGKELDEVDS